MTGGVYDQDWRGLPVPELDAQGNVVYANNHGAVRPVYRADPDFPGSLDEVGGRPLLKAGVDYRSVYLEVLRDFLGLPEPEVLSSVFGLPAGTPAPWPALGLFA